MYFWGYIWVMHLPNSLYLFTEFRHILWQDGVADAWEPTAVTVFGILSLVGLASFFNQVYTLVTKVKFLRNHKVLATVVLCFMSTWGAVLGIHDLVSITGIVFPPAIIIFSLQAFTAKWIIFTLILGTCLSIVSVAILRISETN